jgi:LPS export ABC transporter protein LptC
MLNKRTFFPEREYRMFASAKNFFWLWLAGATVLLTSCENDLSEVNRVFSERDINVEVVKDVEVIYSDSAVVRVTVVGPTMLRYTDQINPREEFPDGVWVKFYDGTGAITSSLTAKKGFRYESRGLIVVRDSVVWQSAANERLDTEELTWTERDKKVVTNKFVVIRRPGEILYGYGFESNQDFTVSRIRAIEGRLKVEELPAAGVEE